MEHIISVVLKELKFGSIKDEMWLSKAGKHHETYNFRSAGERIRRPEPGGGPLLPARLQHRDPDGGPTEDPTLSRMTIVTMGDERVLEQIQKQLHKLVDVLKVCDLSEGEHIEREIALVKARAAGGGRDELKRLADIFRGQIVDVTPSSTRCSWWVPATSWTPSSRLPPRPTRLSKWCAPVSAVSPVPTRRCAPE